MNVFDPQYDFGYKGFHVRIFEIVNKFEGNTPKIVTLKLYIDGQYRTERTFYNVKTEYQRNYSKIMRSLNFYAITKLRVRGKKDGYSTKIF